MKSLDAKASRRELRWLVPLLERAANDPVTRKIDGFAGLYQSIEISVVDGAVKFLGAAGL